MAPRKTSTKIDPIAVTAAALKACKCAADYHTLEVATERDVLQSAWGRLSETDQAILTIMVNTNEQPQPQVLAEELAACGTLLQLQAIKSNYGDVAVKGAWKLLPQQERDRLTSICQNQPQPQEEVQSVTEQPATYSVEPQPRRTLFSISEDLQHLNDLLDEVGDDAQQQELINNWLEAVGEERDRKLDGYAALISEMTARAEVRKAEARRLMELAASDDNRAKLLKERLKSFFQLHDLKTLETRRYKLSLQRNGGRAPLILDDSIPVTQLPEQFQKVSIDADTTAIREALEAGESLEWARIGERGESMRIK